MIESKRYIIVFVLIVCQIITTTLSAEEYAKCKVLEILNIKKIDQNYLDRIETLKVKVLSGKYRGKIIKINNYYWKGFRKYYTISAKPGDVIIARFDRLFRDKILGYVSFYHRSNKILPLLFIFFFFIILITGKKGIRAILALILIYTLLIFLIYLLKTGISPVLLALSFAFMSSFLTFIIVLKEKEKLLASIIGSITGVGIICIITTLVLKYAYISGINTYIGRMVTVFVETLQNFRLTDIKGVIICGVVIATTGAIMDISAGTSSALYEINRSNPDLKFFQLLKSGFSVGKDVIGTMVNTLIFVTLGNMILLFLIFYIMKTPYYRFTNFEFFIITLLPGLVGSIGMVLTVPATVITGALLITLNKKGISFKKIRPLISIIIGIIIFNLSNSLFAWIAPPDYDLTKHPITKMYKFRFRDEYVLARILDIKPYISAEKVVPDTVQNVKVKILTGSFKNKVYTFKNYLWGDKNIDFLFKKGDKSVVWIEKKDNKVKRLFFADRYRFFIIYYLVILFLILLILVCRMLGLKVFISIAISASLIIFVFTPLAAKGFPIIPLTFIVALLMLIVINILIGKNITMTVSSIIGCFSGALIAYMFAFIAGSLLKINGFSLEYIQQLNYYNANFNHNALKGISNLVYVIIIFSATGALTDMGITISSSLNEIYKLNPEIRFKNLFRHGIEIGGDVAGTMINTLILAYAGTNLGFILLWSIGSPCMLHFFNLEFLSIEITKSFAGTLGMLSVIPVTSFVESFLLKKRFFAKVN